MPRTVYMAATVEEDIGASPMPVRGRFVAPLMPVRRKFVVPPCSATPKPSAPGVLRSAHRTVLAPHPAISMGRTAPSGAKIKAPRPAVKRAQPGANAPLMDRLDAEEATPTTNRRAAEGRQRSFESKINKILADNFPNWPSAQVDVLQKEGITLRQRLIRDKRASQQPGSEVKMGKFYYEGLRELYDDGAGPQSKLKVKNELDPEDARLREALIAFVKNKSASQALTEWCQTTGAVNQKNMVALLRTLVRTYPGQNMSLAALLCDVMKMIARLSLAEHYTDELQHMQHHFDLALQKTLGNFKANGLTTQVWWSDCRSYAGLVLPVEKVDRVVTCVGDWSGVETDLADIVGSSAVGRLICERALRSHNADKLDTLARKIIDDLLNNAVTVQTVADARQLFMSETRKDGWNDASGVSKRETTVTYRGVPVKIQTSSVVDLFTCHLEAALRTEAVNSNVLKPLWCESELVVNTVCRCPSIEQALVKDSAVARQVLEDLPTDQTGQAMKGALTQKSNFLLQCDRYFKVEMSFWYQSIGEEASSRLMHSILACFPDPAKNEVCDIEMTNRRLMAVGEGRLLKMCDAGLNGYYTAATECMATLMNGNSPNWKKLGTGSLASKLKEAFGNLCIELHDGGSGSGANAKPSYAATALTEKWGKLQIDLKKSTKVTFATLRPFRQFGWLLSAAQTAALNVLTDEVLKDKSRPSEDVDAAVAPKKKAKRSRDDSTSMVAKLFSN